MDVPRGSRCIFACLKHRETRAEHAKHNVRRVVAVSPSRQGCAVGCMQFAEPSGPHMQELRVPRESTQPWVEEILNRG